MQVGLGRDADPAQGDLFLTAATSLALALVPPSAIAANPASGTTAKGQALNISIDSPAGGATVPTGSLAVAGRTGIGPLTRSANVVYTVDNSGSTYDRGGRDCDGDGATGPGDDVNGDGRGEVAGRVGRDRRLRLRCPGA